MSYLRRALEVEFNDDVHHSLRSCAGTYNGRVDERSGSLPFTAFRRLGRRPNFHVEGPLETGVDRLICARDAPRDDEGEGGKGGEREWE